MFTPTPVDRIVLNLHGFQRPDPPWNLAPNRADSFSSLISRFPFCCDSYPATQHDGGFFHSTLSRESSPQRYAGIHQSFSYNSPKRFPCLFQLRMCGRSPASSHRRCPHRKPGWRTTDLVRAYGQSVASLSLSLCFPFPLSCPRLTHFWTSQGGPVINIWSYLSV